MSSGGKDSLAALQVLAARPGPSVGRLITTCNERNRRVALHGVPVSLLHRQADALGLPMTVIELPENCDNETYIARVEAGLAPLREAGLDTLVFGDLYLEDIRSFREQQFAGTGLALEFPLWGSNTRTLAERLIDHGMRAIVCCIDREVLPETLLGRRWDHAFLSELPDGVDPCGENGEFHTFVNWMPGMDQAVEVTRGEVHVSHQRFCMLDLQPA